MSLQHAIYTTNLQLHYCSQSPFIVSAEKHCFKTLVRVITGITHIKQRLESLPFKLNRTLGKVTSQTFGKKQ